MEEFKAIKARKQSHIMELSKGIDDGPKIYKAYCETDGDLNYFWVSEDVMRATMESHAAQYPSHVIIYKKLVP
ncbi:hypothetical protein FHW88_002766 [Mucilaginibacter sp. SG538B]|uniref:hypothetical protein n=1 Tax=Mucilaginibacter sp. SG538B TaxID=2587021 RepID=UPI00159DFF76|nr:hypothetical protein [Mucilaginibacter sp. SG538B]NVM64477.1 hypothetical protein [Mucilaginibacter sp. SG538B]